MSHSPGGAIILGLTYNGVGAIHSLARMRPRPDPLIAVGTSIDEPGASTRAAEVWLLSPAWLNAGGDLCRELLERIPRNHPAPLLLPCRDEYVRFLSRHREELAERGRFLLPEPETVDTLLDKAALARRATGEGIACPPFLEMEVGPRTEPPIELRFPLVVKARTSLHDDPFAGIVRARLIENREAWCGFRMELSDPPRPLMVQESIPGDDVEQWTYEGLWSQDSEEIWGFTAQKIRQEPPGLGSAAFALGRHDAEVTDRALQLLRNVNYRGLVDVDFKRDPRDGRLYLMEVNPRIGGLHRLSRRLGYDLVQGYFQLTAGERWTPIPPRYGLRAAWCHLATDLQWMRRAGFAHPSGLLSWFASYLRGPTDAVFCWSDPSPWARLMGRLFRRALRRRRRQS